ncbi:hypothetical protein [Staphylococcus phage vB_SsapH-Golestan-105-M]|nr:hypothetical protein [Staphylococcus phage vB_SsapH-Golestan-105-M]
MKKMPDKLKVDKRKKLYNILRDNGLEGTINKGSGIIRIKERRLVKAKRNNDTKEIARLELELKELYSKIEE